MSDLSKRILCVCLLGGLLAGCGPQPTPIPTSLPPAQVTAAATTTATTAPTPAAPTDTPRTIVPAGSARFAPYRPPEVTVQPAVSHEPIAGDLSNVVSAFLLSPQQRQRLAENGFVVSPSEEKEFYPLYEKARYNFEPIFVTSDSLLHVYHLLFDKVLRTIEREQFIPILKELNARMLANSAAQYEALQGTALEEHARRNVAFFGVAGRLLDPAVEVPAYAADLAEGELALIEAHAGIVESPIFPALPYGEDYTQYVPRGHYTRGEDLAAYFRAMMWYGRMTFRIIKPEDANSREETRRALLIVQAMALDSEATSLWQALYEPTVFFVGRSDDLLYTEYIDAVARVYGGMPGDPAAFADEENLTAFMQEAQKLRPPRILGLVIGPETKDVEQETKGFRFMGQRFIPDSYVFRQLVWRNVGEMCPPNRRGLPKGLDILAVMGSERAYALLEQQGDTRYLTYTQNMADLQEEFAGFSEDDWTQNLYWSWLYLFFPLLEEPGEGYPQFMRSQAWLDKSLNTVLGSWAELRHDTILYAKQSYAEMGGGGKGPPPDPVPPKGYVEPVPVFYARLAALAAMTREGLDRRGLLNAVDQDSLVRLEELALALKSMAEKELAGQSLSEGEYERIRFYGGELEHLTFAAADGYAGPGVTESEEEPQAAVVADVATDPDPNCDGGSSDATVLEEGIGRIFTLYAIVPIEGELVLAKGGVFSYYEFPWPASDRLTDEKWRGLLGTEQLPPLPAWTASFRVEETEEAALREAIWRFNRQWIAAAWWPAPNDLQGAATGAALAERRSYVQSLVDQSLYEAYYLDRIAYLSFDLQDADHAVVTTRETWWGERYQESALPGDVGVLMATLPPYTVGVIYRLERINGQWLVSGQELQGDIPGWRQVRP